MYALVIAGGRGERLKPLTDTRPKPMAEVLGKPFLEYHLRWLKKFGVTHAVLLIGYLGEVVKDYFLDGSRLGMEISYNIEDSPLGRGGALKQGFSHVPNTERVVVATNSDVFSDEDLSKVVSRHNDSGCLATIMLVPLISPFGIVDTDDEGAVTDFREKPRLPHWVNGGVYIFNRDIEEMLPELGDHEDSTFPRLAEQGKLGSFKSEQYWKSIDSVKDLREVEGVLSEGKGPRAT